MKTEGVQVAAGILDQGSWHLNTMGNSLSMKEPNHHKKTVSWHLAPG